MGSRIEKRELPKNAEFMREGKSGDLRKSKSRMAGGQTKGQSERDPKGRNGQYTGAGDAPIMKK